MASEHFLAFLAGLHAPIRSKDDLDEFPHVGALFLLEDDERIEAENILIAKLAEDDGRAARALADIRCTRAIPALAERVAVTPSQTMRDYAARAIAELSVDRGLPALLDRLRNGNVDDRLQAVFDLSDWPDTQAEDAVEATAFTDPEPVVRSAALNALFARRDLLLDAEPFRSMLDFISRRALSPLPSVRAEAETELRELFARWAAGQSRRQLGLAWRADRKDGPLKDFVRSVFGESPAEESRRYQQLKESGASMEGMHRPPQRFDYARLAGLTGRERKWIEDVLLSELDSDPDAVHAVALLGIQRAIGPLRELLPVTENVPAAAIEAALQQLEP
jgi:hypothetical protein